MEQSDVEKLIGELELAVDRLRSLYEQYFVGIEKIEPQVPRKDVDRRIYALRKEQIRNTALRFRFQMVLQRYNTYQTHWQRICREIENGTYKRHMIRAQRRFGSVRPPRGPSEAPPPPLVQPGAPLAPDLRAELAELVRDFSSPPARVAAAGLASKPLSPPRPPPMPAIGPPKSPLAGKASILPPRPGVAGTQVPPAAPAAPVWKKVAAPLALQPRPAPAAQKPVAAAPVVAPAASPSPPLSPAQTPPPAQAPPRPPPPAVAPVVQAKPVPALVDLTEERMRQLYSELVETKRRQNESTAAITYQSVAKSLLESSDRLRKKHGRSVDFEVMIKDGKAVLRPVIK